MEGSSVHGAAMHGEPVYGAVVLGATSNGEVVLLVRTCPRERARVRALGDEGSRH